MGMRRSKRISLAVVLATAALLAACAPPPRPLPDRLPLIEGRVVERLDSPPYSFVRLATASGDFWVGVPISAYPKEAVVRVQNAALVRNHRLPALGRTLDAVYFGRLAGP